MNALKLILAVLVISTMNFTLLGQETEKTKKTQKTEIQTSAQCSMCKDRIEKGLAFEKGVKSVDLDLETKIVSIEYPTDKTNTDKLRAAISKIGYDADDLAADEKAYDNLPECCKKGGHD